MKPIRIPTLSPEQLDALEKLYRTTREARLRTRTQMILLAAERALSAPEIAEIVRASEETVRRWLKRFWIYLPPCEVIRSYIRLSSRKTLPSSFSGSRLS